MRTPPSLTWPPTLLPIGSKAPTVESRVALVKEKWNQVQSLLAKWRDQLEMVTGDTASFQETLEGLLSWLGESLRSDEVITTPTSSDQLRRFIDVIQVSIWWCVCVWCIWYMVLFVCVCGCVYMMLRVCGVCGCVYGAACVCVVYMMCVCVVLCVVWCVCVCGVVCA